MPPSMSEELSLGKTGSEKRHHYHQVKTEVCQVEEENMSFTWFLINSSEALENGDSNLVVSKCPKKNFWC